MTSSSPPQKSPLPIVQALIRAQELAGLSSAALARAIEAERSTVSRYRTGVAEVSLHRAVAWAEACGMRLAVVAPREAAVGDLVATAEQLTPEEIEALNVAAFALLESRRSPVMRAVVAAALGLISRQLAGEPDFIGPRAARGASR